MASVFITVRSTQSGKRYRVGYKLGGRGSRRRYAGSFKTKHEATLRKNWIAGELAAGRPPDLTLIVEPVLAPTFSEAAERWQTSRVDIAENTRIQHRTALRKALPVLGSWRVDAIGAQNI